MTDIVAFLTARLDEDEQLVRDNIAWWWDSFQRIEIITANGVVAGGEQYAFPFLDPARVLRKVAAERAILDLHRWQCCAQDITGYTVIEWYDSRTDPCPTLRAMTQSYAEHPDYDPAWAVA